MLSVDLLTLCKIKNNLIQIISILTKAIYQELLVNLFSKSDSAFTQLCFQLKIENLN